MGNQLRKSLRYVPFLGALLFLFLMASPFISHAVGTPDKKKKKLSLRQQKKKMSGWAREIGVKCKYCHVKDGEEFDYEAETAKKKIAAVCAEKFVDRLQLKGKKISCKDCHNRKARFFPRDEKSEAGG